VKNIDESLEAIIECGFTTILDSGQEKNVVEGIVILSELVIKAKNRIVIMPGGLRASNIGLLKKKNTNSFIILQLLST
jgi:copper homeostasis protein